MLMTVHVSSVTICDDESTCSIIVGTNSNTKVTGIWGAISNVQSHNAQ